MSSDLYNNHPNKQHWEPVLRKEEGGRVKFTQNTSMQRLLQLLIRPLPSVYTRGQLNHDIRVSFPHSPWVRALREETFKFLSYELFGVLGRWARKVMGKTEYLTASPPAANGNAQASFRTSHTGSSFKYGWQQRFRGAKKTLIMWNPNKA